MRGGCIMRYIFPFKDFKIGSRIIIYGATQTGYDFFRQIKSTGYCEIIAWVDRQYKWWREMNLPVDEPESVREKEFDTVILTAETERVADSMRSDLAKYGISEEKIYWKNDYLISGNIVKGYDSNRVKNEAEDARLEAPEKYLNDETLDIVIRVMYAKDLLQGNLSEENRNMYKKLMMNQNNGKEPTEDMVHAYFTEYNMKRGWKAFDESFCNLVYSVRDNGFDKEHFIPVDSDGGLINGRHRLAAAIANGIPVWTREYLFSGFHFHFNGEWLSKLGFSNNEINKVVEEYHKLNLEHAIERKPGMS
jgi:hypothetical protein